MNSRTVAAIGLRIIAVWMLFQALFNLSSLLVTFFHGYPPQSSGGTFHRADLSEVLFWSSVPSIALKLIAGFVLFAASKPIGRFITRGLE